MFNLPVSAIKALDSLLAHIQEETVEPIEDSIKGARKNFKAGNYLAIATLFILSGTSIVLSQMFDGQYFIQSLIYFSFALLSLLIFGLIVWRILKWANFSENYKNLKDQISDNDSKVIPYLIFGIVIGRIFEKIIRTKKEFLKKEDE